MSGKGRDREPRRHSFDDEGSPWDRAASPVRHSSSGNATQPIPTADGRAITATVKWFNLEKGFGFVELSDGSGDAFLHIQTLQTAGHSSVMVGAKLRVNVGAGAKGPLITAVLEVDESPAATAPSRFPKKGNPAVPRARLDASSAIEIGGTVKWFNPEKGFGFIGADDNGTDVFVHMSVLKAAGIATIVEGQLISMRVVETPKSREAVSVLLVR